METNNNDSVDQFLNQILDEKKLSGETPESRRQMVADLRSRLMSLIDRAMVNALDTEHLNQLSAMLDSGQAVSDEEMQNFFVKSGVDCKQVALDTMMQFRAYYLGTDA